MGGIFDTLLQPQLQQARELRQFGVYSAIVTGMMDDGTFELRYLSMGAGEPSAPARMVSPMAGAGRGMYFYPEVGDEVIVAFDAGDVNQPYILGAAWNEEGAAPDQAQQSPDNNFRTIVSRCGHEITFDDSAGRCKLIIKTKGGHKLELDYMPPGKVTLQSAAGCKIEMDDAVGSLKISAPLQIEISAPTVKVSGAVLASLEAPIVQVTSAAPVPGVMIDGKPFGAHLHAPPLIPVTGTTGPPTP